MQAPKAPAERTMAELTKTVSGSISLFTTRPKEKTFSRDGTKDFRKMMLEIPPDSL